MDWNKLGSKMEAHELSSAPPKHDSSIVVSGADFDDATGFNVYDGTSRASSIRTLERWVSNEVDANTRAEFIPNGMLRRMGYHPTVYLAEYSITGLARRPNLFHVETDDDAARAEVEEWLWPLLPRLVANIVRAFVYGSAPMIYDWSTSDLEIEVPSSGKSGTRNKRIKNYTRIVEAHDLWLDEVGVITAKNGRNFNGLRYGRRNYPPGRSQLPIWDREFGSWHGNSARRRAAPAWLKSLVFEYLQARYLERSVDPPRIVRAPSGTFKDKNGKDVKVSTLVRRIIASLRNAGVASLPNSLDAAGNPQYGVEVIDLPDRSEVWNHALNRFEGQILTAYLVPPGITGTQDVLSGGGARVTENLFGSFLEMILEFVAAELTQAVGWVWEANHTSGSPPEIKPNKLPERVQKLLLDVLKQISPDDLGKRVDVNELLNQIDVPLLKDAERKKGPADPKGPGGGSPGRPRDSSGEREKRREDAETPEGQDDTGAPRDAA